MKLLAVIVLLISFVFGKDHGVIHDHGHHHTAAPTPAPTTSVPAGTMDPLELINHHIAVEVEHLWTQMDYNKNGNFGRDDLDHFVHTYDTDGDGVVSKLEFLGHWTKDDPGLSMVGEGLFVEMDVNADHNITDADLDGFHDRVDTSKDGTVDKAEFTAYFKQLLTLLYVLSIHSGTGTLG